MDGNVDFSANAGLYDRRHGGRLPQDVVEALCMASGLAEYSRVLEIGAGTGRVSIPMAEGRFRMTALDTSAEMLRTLRTKAAPGLLSVVCADAGAAPFRGQIFDAVIIARVVYLIPNWRTMLSEARRVLKAQGPILYEWGNGTGREMWARVRDKAREIFEQAGVGTPFHPGARFDEDVDRWLQRSGLRCVAEIAGEALPPISPSQFVTQIATGECSYMWRVPAHLRAACLHELKTWVQDQFADDLVENTFSSWKIYR
ncbi:MAG: class I SAM-dependent methyltransferase [Vicinamibacterales bacterium]|jgi:SAM-dependent methyltransferase